VFLMRTKMLRSPRFTNIRVTRTAESAGFLGTGNTSDNTSDGFRSQVTAILLRALEDKDDDLRGSVRGKREGPEGGGG
jgi:hypothetical protein